MLCVPQCPVHAIYPLDEVPPPYQAWVQKNRELWKQGQNLTGGIGPLPGALDLAAIQAREKARGLKVLEPKSFWNDVQGGSGGGAVTR
jgi:hypothetical protein